VIDDITDRKRSGSNEELADFAFAVSHDLEEPVREIRRYSTFLVEDHEDDLDADGKAKLHALLRHSKRLDSRINSLLRYSRAGKADLAFAETDLFQVVTEVIDSLRVALEEQKIEMRLALDFPVLTCDPTRVGEVFLELITNAMKFNNKDEKWIEVGWIPDGYIKGDKRKERRRGRVFYVRDNGIGIRDHHVDKVFRIFKRLHGRDKYGSGIGLGLTIAKKIVERHGGLIWLESQFGEGSTFFFTLETSEIASHLRFSAVKDCPGANC
jgi:light-regulated signal transduction histidine kinase (bacteriophytochrome)